MTEKVLAKLLEGFDAVLDDEKKTELTEMINDIIETRVDAATKEIAEKEEYFLEEAQKLKDAYDVKERKLLKTIEDKEAILKEEAAAFAQMVKEDQEAKEAILFEEVENFKKFAAQVINEEAALYRGKVEDIAAETVGEYREYIEKIALEEAENFAADKEAKFKEQETALVEEVGVFKEGLLEKLDNFLAKELKRSIPENIMEAEAKLAAYSPLVEGMVAVMGKNYIKLDSTSYEVVKEAREEIDTLKESVSAKVRDNVQLKSEIESLRKDAKVRELTEGLTTQQKQKATKLLESYKAEEVEDKFNTIKDMIITESVEQPKKGEEKVEKPTTAKKATEMLSESRKKKVQKILNENSGPKTEMDDWADRLEDQMNK